MRARITALSSSEKAHHARKVGIRNHLGGASWRRNQGRGARLTSAERERSCWRLEARYADCFASCVQQQRYKRVMRVSFPFRQQRGTQQRRDHREDFDVKVLDVHLPAYPLRSAQSTPQGYQPTSSATCKQDERRAFVLPLNEHHELVAPSLLSRQKWPPAGRTAARMRKDAEEKASAQRLVRALRR